MQLDAERPHRAARARRARAQAEAICAGAAEFAQSIRGPITDLTATLLTAWAYAGAGDSQAAVDTIDKLSGPDWYAIFKDLHAALILDLAGNKKDAAKRYERAYKLDAVALRIVQAYGRFLSRNGNKDEALKVYSEFDKTVAQSSADRGRAKQVTAGKKLPLLVDSRRRPAPPRRCTASALRSAAAAARISRSSICSSRSISRRTIRWRCCRSPISTRR